MDLKQLEYFVRVAELGSFTRAATALNIAQPALSRQVRLLEVELRQNLLTRNGRGAVPTEAGKLLLEHGRGILHQVALAHEELDNTRGALAGKVSIGLPPSLSKLITVPLTHAFRAGLPQARLTLTEGFSLLMLEGLRIGSLDMAVLYNANASPDLEVATLYEEELVLISPRSAWPAQPGAWSTPNGPQITTKGIKQAKVPLNKASTAIKLELTDRQAKAAQAAAQAPNNISLAEVAMLPLILPSRPNAFRVLIDTELAAIGQRPQITMEVDGLNAILNLVAEGLGHAVLPRYTLSNFDNVEPFQVRSISSPRIMSRLELVTSSRRPSTQTQKKALEIVRAVVLRMISK